MVLYAPSHPHISILVHLVGAIKLTLHPSYGKFLTWHCWKDMTCVCLCVLVCRLVLPNLLQNSYCQSKMAHFAPPARRSNFAPHPLHMHQPRATVTITATHPSDTNPFTCLSLIQTHAKSLKSLLERTIKVTNPILNCASNLIFRPWYLY